MFGLFPTTNLSIPLDRPAAQALASLEAKLVPTARHRPLRGSLAGDVSAHHIRIRCRRPLVRNHFAPRFAGAISADGRHLEGRFETPRAARLFTRVWLVLLLAFILPTQIAYTARQGLTRENAVALPVVIALVVLGAFVPRLGWWFGRADVETIEAAIRESCAGAGA